MDWIAAIFELVGCWLLGYKSRWAFVVFLFCNVLWAVVGFNKGINGLTFMVLIFAVMNIRNWIKWG